MFSSGEPRVDKNGWLWPHQLTQHELDMYRLETGYGFAEYAESFHLARMGVATAIGRMNWLADAVAKERLRGRSR